MLNCFMNCLTEATDSGDTDLLSGGDVVLDDISEHGGETCVDDNENSGSLNIVEVVVISKCW